MHQLEEVDAAISDTDDVFFNGIDTRVISVFDLRVLDSAPTHYDDLGALNHQIKSISTTSRDPHRFADFLRQSGNSAVP